MQLALSSFHPMNARAVVGSIALHAMAVVGLVSFTAPATTIPQQIIAITMLAPPAASEEKKPESVQKQPIQPAQQQEKKRVQKTIKKDALSVQRTPEKAVAASKQTPLSASKAASADGKTPDAPPRQNTVTTTPSFDAAYLQNPAPEYPAQAKRRRMEGVVTLRVMVSEQGSAQSVQIAKTSGFPLLDASALEVVQRWKFIPAKSGNTPIAAQVMVPIEFRLE